MKTVPFSNMDFHMSNITSLLINSFIASFKREIKLCSQRKNFKFVFFLTEKISQTRAIKFMMFLENAILGK